MTRWVQHGFHHKHFMSLHGDAHTRLYVGDGATAHARVEETWPALRGAGLLGFPHIRAPMLDLRGRCALAAALEPTDTRPRLIGSAIAAARRLEKERRHWATPMAQLLRGQVAALRQERTGAEDHLRAALSGFEAAEMALYAAAAGWRLGEVMGGDAGQELAAASETWLRGQGVRRPDRLVAMVAPVAGGAISAHA